MGKGVEGCATVLMGTNEWYCGETIISVMK